MNTKAAEAFRTISEVADDLEVPKHVLRFWEAKFPQIRPMKRGGGRRYYRPGDMELLRGIRHLLHSDGYTIKGVQRILREQGVEAVKFFGRGTPPVAVPDMAPPARKPAARTRQPAERALEPAAAVVGSTARAPALVEPREAANDTAGLNRELMLRMIHELQACRERLRDGDRGLSGTRSARRPRSARG